MKNVCIFKNFLNSIKINNKIRFFQNKIMCKRYERMYSDVLDVKVILFTLAGCHKSNGICLVLYDFWFFV